MIDPEVSVIEENTPAIVILADIVFPFILVIVPAPDKDENTVLSKVCIAVKLPVSGLVSFINTPPMLPCAFTKYVAFANNDLSGVFILTQEYVSAIDGLYSLPFVESCGVNNAIYIIYATSRILLLLV